MDGGGAHVDVLGEEEGVIGCVGYVIAPGVSFFLMTASAIFMKNWAISDRDRLIFLPIR